MRKVILTTAVMLASHAASQAGALTGQTDSSLTLPWSEFKTLYTEKIQQQYKKKDVYIEPVISIDEAHYKVMLKDDDDALVEVSISGTFLQGEPEPVSLFDRSVAIREINEVEGGTVISDASGYKFYLNPIVDHNDSNFKNNVDTSSINTRFYDKPFHTRLSLMIPLEEDKHSRYLSFKIPSAVKNILDVELPLGVELIEHPGQQESLQRYYFPTDEQLHLRFFNTKHVQQKLKIDTFTQIELQGDKYIFSMLCIPLQPLVQESQIEFIQPVQYLDSTLKPSRINTSDKNLISILPKEQERATEPFVIRFEVNVEEKLSNLRLPFIKNNFGRQGDFQVVGSVETQISIDSDHVRRHLSFSTLPRTIQTKRHIFFDDYDKQAEFNTLENGQFFSLSLQRFDTVETPEVVLQDLYFYTSFAENGSEISVIRMTLPQHAGDRLMLNIIPGAEIWSLTVNGEKRDVFTHKNNAIDSNKHNEKAMWVIPLTEGKESIVELTYLQKHKKLGLEGKLPITIPAIGMAAQNVLINIGLVDRVELVAMEGELSPTVSTQIPVVESFTGTPHIFQYPFYKGDALEAVLFYKEPLTNLPTGANLQTGNNKQDHGKQNWLGVDYDG